MYKKLNFNNYVIIIYKKIGIIMLDSVEVADIGKYDFKLLNSTEIQSLNRIFRFNEHYEKWFKTNKTLNGFSNITFVMLNDSNDGRNIRESLDGLILLISTKSIIKNVDLTLYLKNYTCPNINDIYNLNYDVQVSIKWYEDKYMLSNIELDTEGKQIITNKINSYLQNVIANIFMLLKEIIIDDLAKLIVVKLTQNVF